MKVIKMVNILKMENLKIVILLVENVKVLEHQKIIIVLNVLIIIISIINTKEIV